MLQVIAITNDTQVKKSVKIHQKGMPFVDIFRGFWDMYGIPHLNTEKRVEYTLRIREFLTELEVSG